MKRCTVVVLASIVLWGCDGGGGSDPITGNPVKSQSPLFSLASSKLGASGGFADVDGDGNLDAVVGAPSATKDASLGVALVYKGGSALHGITNVTPTAVTGDNSFGASFRNLGDVDGDDKADYAISATYGDGDKVSMSGAVHIYKGGSNKHLIKKLSGEIPMDRFGMTLASGDLNGDGKNDIIIGAPYFTPSAALYQNGAVYVYFGPDFSASVRLASSSTNKALGWSVAAGDINNDNISDLLMMANGKVLGFYGNTTFTPAIDTPDVTISSPATDFGRAITVFGDVDGDGFKDVAISAPKATVGTNRDTGMLFIVKGGAGARTIALSPPPPAPVPVDLIVRIDGAKLFDRFGASMVVMDAGDGDNLMDLVVSAPMADIPDAADPTKTNYLAGKVYLFKGKDLSTTTTTPITIAAATVYGGSEKYQGFGTWLAVGPEHHLFIGMPGADGNDGDAMLVDLSGKHPASSFFGAAASTQSGDQGGQSGGDGSDDNEQDHH